MSPKNEARLLELLQQARAAKEAGRDEDVTELLREVFDICLRDSGHIIVADRLTDECMFKLAGRVKRVLDEHLGPLDRKKWQ